MIFFATSNDDKLKEFKELIGRSDINRIHIDVTEIQGTPKEVCIAKSKEASRIAQGATIVEDSNLCYNALGGMPGPYIKMFLEKLGLDGLYKLLEGFEDKSAYALCYYAYCAGPGKETVLFCGKTDGTIVQPRGANGFGWDAVFQPAEYHETYAEMDKTLKNVVSDRSKAIQKLKKFLVDLDASSESPSKIAKSYLTPKP